MNYEVSMILRRLQVSFVYTQLHMSRLFMKPTESAGASILLRPAALDNRPRYGVPIC